KAARPIAPKRELPLARGETPDAGHADEIGRGDRAAVGGERDTIDADELRLIDPLLEVAWSRARREPACALKRIMEGPDLPARCDVSESQPIVTPRGQQLTAGREDQHSDGSLAFISPEQSPARDLPQTDAAESVSGRQPGTVRAGGQGRGT